MFWNGGEGGFIYSGGENMNGRSFNEGWQRIMNLDLILAFGEIKCIKFRDWWEWRVLRYKFSSLKFFSPLTKIPTQVHKLFCTHINISHIYYPNILHVIGPSQILHTQSHKFPWALSQILPILSNLDFPQIILITLLPKLGYEITLSPQKAQNHFTCGWSPKRPNNTIYKPYC